MYISVNCPTKTVRIRGDKKQSPNSVHLPHQLDPVSLQDITCCKRRNNQKRKHEMKGSSDCPFAKMDNNSIAKAKEKKRMNAVK